MTLTQRELAGVAVLDLAGRLTSSDGAGLLEERVKMLVAGGQSRIVLNLSHLSYVDSGGLGEMVACYTTMRKVGGAIRLANVGTRVQDLLAITKLVTVFDSYDSESEAVSSFTMAPAVEDVAEAGVAVGVPRGSQTH